jgi:Domain of unknown function (DUF397)
MEAEGNWRKSSYSGANGGECVEVATMVDAVLVRDSTDRGGDTLTVSAAAWRAFVAAVR